MDSTQKNTHWALVTGASAGIGSEFARQLAARGVNLVLSARRLDRLTALADELKAKHAVAIECISADLADPAAARALVEQIHHRGIAIDVLINNAGYGVPGKLTAPTWQQHADFIQVLMTAPVELCYLLLPGMQQRSYGRIVNVASLAGHMPSSAGNTLYGAAKAFLIKFSQSLALENSSRGIHVCALCPGFTRSEFHDVSGARGVVSKMPDFMWMNADVVVRQGLDAVERGDVVYINGRVNRLMRFFGKHLPDRMALKLIQRQSKRFRVQDGK